MWKSHILDLLFTQWYTFASYFPLAYSSSSLYWSTSSKKFGKLKLGFLLNVFFAFIFTGVHYCLNIKTNTHLLGEPICQILAYLTQYFFLAFFFWMSSMAINITWRFSNIMTASKEKKGSLLVNTLYAQGVPLFISSITYLVDHYGTDQFIFPNMGKYSCFLGSPPGNEDSIFLKFPKFLYFYLIISLLMITNLICLIITGIVLVSTWKSLKLLQINLKTQCVILLKIFMILGELCSNYKRKNFSFIFSGIPWVTDVISGSLDHTYKESYSEATLVLDIINLLTVR